MRAVWQEHNAETFSLIMLFYHKHGWMKVLWASCSNLCCARNKVRFACPFILWAEDHFTVSNAGKDWCSERKRFRGVDVSLIALSVKVQLKMLRGELNQHSCSSLSNKEILFQSADCLFLLWCTTYKRLWDYVHPYSLRWHFLITL